MTQPSCRFSILVKRSKNQYTQEELDLMSVKERRYLKSASGYMGSGYVQLEDQNGNIRSFSLMPGTRNSCIRAIELASPGVSFAIADLSGEPACNILAGAITVGMPSGVTGRVSEHQTAMAYDDRLDYAITKDKYDAILNELTDHKTKYYNLALRNCSGYAVDIARRNGLDAPPCTLMTPHRLSNHILSLSKEYNAVQDEFAAADNKIMGMFSEQEQAPKPERIKGQPITLMDRLKSDKGLELG